MRVLRFALPVLLAFAVSAAGARAAEPKVKDLACTFKGQDLAVTLGVEGALDAPDIKEAIHSTRPFTLTYTVNIVKRLSAWPDRIRYQTVVKRTVRFDNLTRQYVLETVINGESTDKRRVATWEEMSAYMTTTPEITFAGVAKLDLKSGSYSLRAKVLVQTQFFVVIFPYDVETPWADRPLAPP
jgi:hypothetical protein